MSNLNSRQFQGYEEVHHSELAGAISHDWGVSIKDFPKVARKAWKQGDLTETRAADYEDYGGPEGWATKVGAGQEHGHTEPIQLERDGDRTYVVQGNHRALDAVQRKLPRVPVEWI